MTDLRARLADALTEALRGNVPVAEHLADVLLSLPGIEITETLPGFGYTSGGSDV